jgi:hypothetical protein
VTGGRSGVGPPCLWHFEWCLRHGLSLSVSEKGTLYGMYPGMACANVFDWRPAVTGIGGEGFWSILVPQCTRSSSKQRSACKEISDANFAHDMSWLQILGSGYRHSFSAGQWDHGFPSTSLAVECSELQLPINMINQSPNYVIRKFALGGESKCLLLHFVRLRDRRGLISPWPIVRRARPCFERSLVSFGVWCAPANRISKKCRSQFTSQY